MQAEVKEPVSDLIVIPEQTALAVFTTADAIDPYLERIRKEIDAFVPDISTSTGRKAVASMAYKVARSKTYLDGVGKKLVDEQKDIPRKIDACRKRVRDTLDQWRDEVRQPLTDWESAEDARQGRHKAEIARIDGLGGIDANSPSEAISAALADIEGISVGDHCEEYVAAYAQAKDQAVGQLKAKLAARLTHEAEQAELERLRKEKAEREQREREERIRQEGAAKAKAEAEAAAKAERDRMEAAAKAERDAAERRELELKLAAEAAERRAIEAAQRAKEDAERKIREEAAERARREADRDHRAKINRIAVAAFKDQGLSEDIAKTAVKAIA